MDANKRNYTELVGGGVQFVIPVFQRDYNWSEEQCGQLWDDIARIGQKEIGDHFFGPVVYIVTRGHSAAFTRWLLIDGQQRMTTVSLLMAAVRDHIRQEALQDAGTNPDKIEHDFLINTYESEGQRPKLVLRERDENTLRYIVDDEEEPAGTTKSATVAQNYQFFREKLRNADVDVIVEGVGRLAVVDVRLERGKDDPQQIFESLNSTGLDLTQADLVRNYVLMGLEEEAQTKLYKKYWQKLEQLYVGSVGQMDNFLRDFVALETKAQKQGRIDQVYSSFRLAFDKRMRNPEKLEKLLKKMRTFARFHAAFVMGSREFSFVADNLGRIRALATTPAILIMRLLHAHELEHIAERDLAEALDTIEGYLVRRDVCGLQTRSYWQQFSKLAYALKKSDVFGSLKVNLHWLADTNYAFPTDREFQGALTESDLYGRQICRTLLDRLEHGESRERADTSAYTIEHIMPQNENLHPNWQKMLGGDWEEVHEVWLHRLGNLTLTAYNERYSDKPFDTKKSITNGFNDSPLRLNKYISKQNEWTSKQMSTRGKLLAKQALEIWSPLLVSRESIRQAEVARLLDSSGDIDATKDGMDIVAKKIFVRFQNMIGPLKEDVVEVASAKSVSYHSRKNAECFCEVLPRAHRILLLLGIDIGESVDCELDVFDTADYKFFPHSKHDAGCFVEIYSVEEVVCCEPLVRQAFAISMD